MPKEYIERDALINQIRLTASRTNLGEIKPNNISGIEICGLIFNAPAADVVEVVRCRECKLWTEETGWCCRHSHFIGAEGEACHPWESNDWKTFDENDFCSYGERKDGAER